jgi:hypothetical protein
MKIAITTKVKPDIYFVEQCKPFLKLLTHEDFKGLLLPALLKAMLRSPEIILGSVGQVLASVSIDLSAYAADLAKPIVTCLHSKEDVTREEAAFATEALAKQCSEVAAVRGLLSLYFGVLQGSEGKLTLSSHKISVLEGIGHLSKHCATGSSTHQLSCDAAEHFVKIMDTEIHEGTLHQALSALLLWANRFTNAIPKSLIEMFKKGMGLKTSTPGIRTGYIRCMAASLHGESLPQGIELIPVLLKSLERATAQPTQAAVVSEGLTAATLLLRCANLDVKVIIILFESKCHFHLTFNYFRWKVSAPLYGIFFQMETNYYLSMTKCYLRTVKRYGTKLFCYANRSSSTTNNGSVIKRRLTIVP